MMPIIEKINECFQQCENMLPTIEEITLFEESLIELNHLTFGKGSMDIIVENARSFEGSNNEIDTLGVEHRKEELAMHKAKIEDLKKNLASLNTQYDKKVGEREVLHNKLKEFSTDSDIILCFKLATISHLSYNKKINFGFLMKKNKMDYRTFAYNIDENSPEEIEDRWTSLRSFISCEEKRPEDE